MLSSAARAVANRLVDPLVILARAVAGVAGSDGTPAFPFLAASLLYVRLARLVARLVKLVTSAQRPRAGRPSRWAVVPPVPAAAGRPPALRLRRRPGWLLDALPDLAPAIAGDLAALLADPAAAELFAADPTLDRALRTVLSGLGLTPPAPAIVLPGAPLTAQLIRLPLPRGAATPRPASHVEIA